MTGEQSQTLVDSINRLSDAIYENTFRVSEAISEIDHLEVHDAHLTAKIGNLIEAIEDKTIN